MYKSICSTMQQLFLVTSALLLIAIGSIAGHFHGKAVVYEQLLNSYQQLTDIEKPR